MNRPLSRSWNAIGWAFATLVFVGGTQLIGGVTSGDASDSINTTWAIAHGQLACAYPPGNQYGLAYTGPLYPYVSGALTAILRIGHQVPFPTAADFGAHCAKAAASMYYWSLHSGAQGSTLLVGYVCWLAILFGMVAVLRTSGRGRTGWEPFGLVLLAIVPPVFMCLHEYFHPQDLLAMGLILGGVACVRRESWIWCGILLGLAFTSQPFALLALAPLIVIAPPQKLVRFLTATLCSIVVVVAPLAAFAPKAALRAALTGTGTTWTSVTMMDESHISGPLLIFGSRYLPIAAAMALAWWAQHRLGTKITDPVPLISLIASSLSFRLIFEVNLWGYYFMAVAVSVLVLDVVRGRLRWSYFAWLILIVVAFHPVIRSISAWGFSGTRWFSLLTWQLILAPLGSLLAVKPLLDSVKRDRLQIT